MSSPQKFDLAVVGAGIVGLAHAVDAAARGLRVVVIERDARAVGASIRNFGHICTTVQSGEALAYARVAHQRWLDLAAKAGLDVRRTGTVLVARTGAEAELLQQFVAARPDEAQLLTDAETVDRIGFAPEGLLAGAVLPHDLRTDPRAVVPAIAAWLAGEGVELRFDTFVTGVEPGVVHTSRGDVAAVRIVHCVGHDVDRLFPELAAQTDIRRCRLHMLEVAPPNDITVEPAVLTGLGMLRYGGLAEMPAAADVRRDFEQRSPELLDVVMNLMITQRPDGSIVLGDTHHYDRTLLPFLDESVDALVLREGARLLGGPLTVRRRWTGVYADATTTDFLIAEPHPGVRVVSVTSGIGMTTALGLAPSVLDQLLP